MIVLDSSPQLDIFEAERRPAILKAFKGCFHYLNFDSIRPLDGGYSASRMYKVTAGSNHYVLRVMDLAQPIEDRIQQLTCGKIASQLGVAPQIHYADADDGILLMDFIQQDSQKDEHWVLDLAQTLRILHNSPTPFPTYLGPVHFLSELVKTLRNDSLPQYLKSYFRQIEEIADLLERNKKTKSCHNDLNGGNILWNGNKPILVDFEAAGQEDPFFDLATVINHFIFDSELERRFLSIYFESNPSSYQTKKLKLAKQLSFCYYAAHFLSFARVSKVNFPTETELMSSPPLAEIRTRLDQGSLLLQTPEDWMKYGASFICQSLIQIRSNPTELARPLTQE